MVHRVVQRGEREIDRERERARERQRERETERQRDTDSEIKRRECMSGQQKVQLV